MNEKNLTADVSQASAGKISGIVRFLDEFFHVSERGSTVSREIVAGFGAFLVAVCALLLNTQIIGVYYGNYAGSYFAIAVVAFLATMVMGVWANVPYIQTASLSVSSLMVAYIGAETGLTYYNLLFVMFLSSVICFLILVTPAKRLFLEGIPDGVKKALPVGLGLYFASVSLKRCGLISEDGILASAKALSEMDNVYFWIMIAGFVVFIMYAAFGRVNALGSTYLVMIAAMWVIGIVYFMENFVGGQTATTLVYQRVNLIVATDGASPYTIAAGISSLSLGKVFTKGLDFSAYSQGGGNVVVFVIQSIFTFVLFLLYSNSGVMEAAKVAGELEKEQEFETSHKKVMLISALSGVVATLLGAPVQAVAPESVMETKDGAKTGLASLAAGIGYLISLFTWTFFALTATTTNGVGMWINDTETKLAAYVLDTFVFASFIMLIVGIIMLKNVRSVNVKDSFEWIPFAVTVGIIALCGNVGVAVAGGCLAFVLLKIGLGQWKSLPVPLLILTVVLVAYTGITLYYGTDFVTQVQMGGMAGGPPA